MNEIQSSQDMFFSVIINYGLYLVGISIFFTWLVRTSLGTESLTNSVPRRTNMPIYLPFVPLLIWFGFSLIVIGISEKIWPELPDWANTLINNLAMCTGATAAFVITLRLVRKHFSRRIKGLGLDVKTIPKDLGFAILNLLSVWPLLLCILLVTAFVGRLFSPDFEIQRHSQLEKISQHSQIYVKILIFITTTTIMPLIEELLFRGLFQTIIRSITSKPWLSITLVSLLFTSIHVNAEHWPALFALSMCMGYSYEKSGSLFRPMFIHIIFNTSSMITVMMQSG